MICSVNGIPKEKVAEFRANRPEPQQFKSAAEYSKAYTAWEVQILLMQKLYREPGSAS